MGSSNSSGLWKGGKWENCLKFWNGRQWVQVSEDKLILFFQKELHADEEIIESVEHQYHGLFKIVPAAELGLYHAFTTVETTNWHWSFDKMAEGIHVQRSKKKDEVCSYFEGKMRTKKPSSWRSAKFSNGKNILEVAKWIIDSGTPENELNKIYHVWKQNCQLFAHTIYGAFEDWRKENMETQELMLIRMLTTEIFGPSTQDSDQRKCSDIISQHSQNNKKTYAEVLSESLAAPSTQVSLVHAAELTQDSDQRKCSAIISQHLQISDLKKTIQTDPNNNKKTFAEALSKPHAAPSTQVSLKTASKLAQESNQRKCSVIIRNARISSDPTNDDEFGSSIAKECQTADSCLVFRIPRKQDAPPLIKLTFKSEEDAQKTMMTFDAIKTRVTGCRSASIRPDLSKPDLFKYREAWKSAIEKNNAAGKKLYTVRNLEVTMINYRPGEDPHLWTVQPKKK
ncbi:hypothetical protein CAEBREN_06627 [Caenorhabditis brenneri]|uniref:Uncharacterized protein n=1 Tax=Caenorhabditis brenneri TaxID=135651 RepID=G0MPJ3_CAEBE|nr:hypothetical protein CAEBREN_06627 [Caenorhabditis brenneri]